jgi:hypothetical protein
MRGKEKGRQEDEHNFTTRHRQGFECHLLQRSAQPLAKKDSKQRTLAAELAKSKTGSIEQVHFGKVG